MPYAAGHRPAKDPFYQIRIGTADGAVGNPYVLRSRRVLGNVSDLDPVALFRILFPQIADADASNGFHTVPSFLSSDRFSTSPFSDANTRSSPT